MLVKIFFVIAILISLFGAFGQGATYKYSKRLEVFVLILSAILNHVIVGLLMVVLLEIHLAILKATNELTKKSG